MALVFTVGENVKRASNRVRVRVTDPAEIEACLRAWPSVTRLVVSRPVVSRPVVSAWAVSRSTITDLVLEDAVMPLDAGILFGSVRTLSLVRCSAATLEFPELVSLSISAPIGGVFPETLARTIRAVHCTDVSLGILGPVSTLPNLETLSLTRPYPSASVPNPFAVIGAIETLTSLSLCHFDAMNVYIERTQAEQIKMRLHTLRIEFCLVCADDPLLAYPHHSRRSNHECSEYTRRIEIGARSPPKNSAVAAIAEIPEYPSSYETYVRERLACPLIHHQHGLRLLFAASLVEFERTHAATAHNARRLVAA